MLEIEKIELPENWKIKPLGNFTALTSKKHDGKVLKEVYTVSTRFGFIRSDEFFDKQVYSFDTTGYRLVPSGSFAYNPYRINVGSLARYDGVEDALVSSAYVVFKITKPNELDSEFLLQLFEHPILSDEISRYAAARGAVRKSLAFKDLATFKILLPPLLEQQAIATALRTIRHARQTTVQELEAAKELKRSLMRHLFTYGAVSVQDAAAVELQETEIGQMPKDWEVKKLGEVAKLSTGTTPSTKNLEYYGGLIPFLKTGEIDGETIERTNETLTELALNDYSLTIYPIGTIFMAMYGQGKTRGQVAISKISLTTTQNAAAIQVENKEIYNWFLFEYLKSQYLRLRADGHHVQITHLSLAHLRQFLIPIPDLIIQEEIFLSINLVAQKISALESRVSALDSLFQSALHSLMTGQKRLIPSEVFA